MCETGCECGRECEVCVCVRLYACETICACVLCETECDCVTCVSVRECDTDVHERIRQCDCEQVCEASVRLCD